MGSKPYDPRDAYYRKAKQAGLRARSAYKLEEIARRFGLYRPGMTVLDLGAAPGGWLQILSRLVGPHGLVVGVDLQPIEPVAPNVRTVVGDIHAEATREAIRALRPDRFDALTSDMAPKTTGIKDVDESRSIELVRTALELCDEYLAQGGSLVAKVFEGGEFPALLAEFRQRFERVRLVRPEATRGRSFEIYVVATGFRGGSSGQLARDEGRIRIPPPSPRRARVATAAEPLRGVKRNREEGISSVPSSAPRASVRRVEDLRPGARPRGWNSSEGRSP